MRGKFETEGRKILWREWEGSEKLWSNNLSNPRTSRDWLQLEPLSIILRLKEISPCVYKTYNLIKTPFLFMKNLN